jgi:hypothetical protein
MTSLPRNLIAVAFFAASSTHLVAQPTGYTFENAQAFLSTYCKTCHQGKSPAGGFDVQRVGTPASLVEDSKWTALSSRVRNREMPPKGAPAPNLDQREEFTKWVGAALQSQACFGGIVPGPAPIRRLNRDEYTATLQNLLDLHMDIGQALPADGAGGEGFDNAAEALFLSPLHSEKYLEAAKLAMDAASKEFKSRQRILVARPGPGVSPAQAAREILKSFLPRAFRRPVTETDIAPYLELFRARQKQGQSFESAIFFALRGALISPLFLFRTEPANNTPEVRPLDQYSLASRLSYFLWSTMPEPLLFDLAEEGKLNQPEVLKALVQRMLGDERSVLFFERFVGQWLRTKELGANKVPDAKMFPTYANEELRSDIRYQPVLFFREVVSQNLSLLNLLDSKYTIGTRYLAELYKEEKFPKKPGQQPQWLELPRDSNRGGLLGMAAVLAVSSYPHRTSPVLRGAWILESLLGTPPPPPPPVVPALVEDHAGAAPTSVRERLTQHRADPVCASCHSRIDPLGFALENFDALGGWRDQDGGKPVDSSAELADGTKFRGPAGLKAYLLERKDLFVRNLASKMLGYALGRGLRLQDSCVVDNIVAEVKDNGYSARTLIEAIVLSVPFRYQAAGVASSGASSAKEERKP